MDHLEYIVPEPSALVETLAPIFLGIIFAIFLNESHTKAKITSFLGLWFSFNVMWALSAIFPAIAAASLPTSILLNNITIIILGATGIALSMWLWSRHLSNRARLHLQHSAAFVVYIIGIYLFSWRKNMMWALQPDDAPKLTPEELILFASRWGLFSIILASIFLWILNKIVRFIVIIIMVLLSIDPNAEYRDDLLSEDFLSICIAASTRFVLESVALPLLRSPVSSCGKPIVSFINWIRCFFFWIEFYPAPDSMPKEQYDRELQILLFRYTLSWKIRTALYSVKILVVVFSLLPQRLVPRPPERKLKKLF